MMAENLNAGNLSEKSLAHLLLWVYENSFTGVLMLAREEIKKSLVFEKGKLIAARSNIREEILGAILIEEGKIKPADFEISREKLPGDEVIRQGEILIRMGLIDYATLNETLEKQLLRRAVEAFTWPEGLYRFVSKIPEESARIHLDKSLLEICYRGLLKKYQDSKEAAELPESAVPNFVGGQTWNVANLRLVGKEMSLYRAINGVATLAQIVERSRGEGPAVRAMLLALRDMGLVRLAAEDKKPTDLRETPAETEGAKAGSGTAPSEEAAALLESFQTKNHFEVLGVARNASTMEIKNAYFALAKKHHPDRAGFQPGSPERKKIEDLFARISEAHGALTNDAARKEYEATLDLAQSGLAGGAEVNRILESEIAYQKAIILVRKGDFTGAIDFLRQAIGLYDKEPEYHLLLGWALYRAASKNKDVQGAKTGKTEIEKALARNERLSQGHFYLGLIAKSEGDIERAKRYFEKTVQLDPNHNEANSELRLIHMRKSKEAPSGGLKGLFKRKES